MGKKRKAMRGTVEKIIKPVSPMEPEKRRSPSLRLTIFIERFA